MTVSQEIIKHASSLFDVVGFSRLSSSHSLLILGLESTPERNLDEFWVLEDKLQINGFKKHIRPRIESLLKLIRSKGFFAESLGRYGYPLEGEVNLKELAIRAGLGRRGKSTIMLHPKFGTRLRLAAIKTDAPFKQSVDSALPEEENPFCDECTICIDVCPVNALEPYSMPDTAICLSNVNIMPEENDRLIPCDICLHRCPANY